jgi:hypothetical protein
MMLRVALEIAFWAWCVVLLGLAALSASVARGLSGESGGPAVFAFTLLCIVLLAISLVLRFTL